MSLGNNYSHKNIIMRKLLHRLMKKLWKILWIMMKKMIMN